MDRLASLPSPVSMPWESAPPVVMETAREASVRLGLSPRALIGRAIRRGHLAPSPPGRPREGQSVRLAGTVWNLCKRRVKHARRPAPPCPQAPPWTPTEDATLLRLTATVAGRAHAFDWPAVLAALPGRTRYGCAERRQRLRQAIVRGWTPAEDAIVAAGYARTPKGDLLAALPGRTWGAIERRVIRLRAMGIAVNTRRAAGVGRRERE